MSRTGFTVATAAVLAVLSVAVLLTRRELLGDDIHGPRGASRWDVNLRVSGETGPESPSLITLTPPDFRQQQIYDEEFISETMKARPGHDKATGRRETIWERVGANGQAMFELTYSFRCVLGLWPPTPGMERMTQAHDTPPAKGGSLKPGPRIESEHREVQGVAKSIAGVGMNRADQVKDLFEYVRRLEQRPAPVTQSALGCLRARGGGSAGKARLLVALCRNRSIPARLVTGLILEGEGRQEVHCWAEVWVNDYWLPLCPTRGHFGDRALPRSYLVLNVGDQDVVRARQSTFAYEFEVQRIDAAGGDGDGAFWKRFSLYTLRPAEQQLVLFLLLLPLAALIVCVFRTVVGVPTFGTFAPALMGMAFLDLKVLPYGLAAFGAVILLGWGLRRLLERFHLLMVPRVSALLTLIVLVLVAWITVSSHLGLPVTSYLSLFPLVILTHLVERFWTVESEDGTAVSFQTLVGTFVVTVAVSVALSPAVVGTWVFRYPETVGVVLACQLLLGRYTGYRLSELHRFKDLIQEETAPGGTHVVVAKVAQASGNGGAGDEPPQRGVHPRPESAEPVPAGGRQAADAGPVPADRRADA